MAHDAKTKAPVRVLHIKQGLGVDGASRMLVGLAQSAAPLGYVFDVLIDEPLASAHEGFVRAIASAGGRIFSIADAWDASGRRIPLKLFKLMYSFKVMRGGYGIAHLQTDTPSRVQLLMVAKAAGVGKRIVHSHNSSCEAAGVEPQRQDRYRSAMGKIATDYISCSEAAAQWLFPSDVADSHRYTLLRNGIDVGDYRFDRRRRAEARESLGVGSVPVVACVGRLAAQKNLSFALEVFDQLLQIGGEARLLIVGDGDQREALERDVEKRGLQGRVSFLGVRDDVVDLLQAADVLLMPSLFEGLPVVLVEAQAASLPCVVSDGVTRSAAFSDLVSFVSLSEPASAWAREVLRQASRQREDVADIVLQAGYDIEASARKLIEVYEA